VFLKDPKNTERLPCRLRGSPKGKGNTILNPQQESKRRGERRNERNWRKIRFGEKQIKKWESHCWNNSQGQGGLRFPEREKVKGRMTYLGKSRWGVWKIHCNQKRGRKKSTINPRTRLTSRSKRREFAEGAGNWASRSEIHAERCGKHSE